MHFSKKFKRAWMKSNQRMHDMLLARPKTRYLQRWPDPALERSLPAPVPVAALRARATARTLELSKPKATTPSPPPKHPGAVDPACLKFEPSTRLMELARPALKSRPVSPSSMKSSKAKRKLYNKERVNFLAKRHIASPPAEDKDKKKGKPLSELMPRIIILCELPKRYQQPELPPVPIFSKIQLEKKGYELPERIQQLARPREFAEFKLDEDYDPYTINPAALTYKATDNINKLAEPRRKEEKRIKKG